MASRPSSTTTDLSGHSRRSWHAAPTPDSPAPTIKTSTVSTGCDIDAAFRPRAGTALYQYRYQTVPLLDACGKGVVRTGTKAYRDRYLGVPPTEVTHGRGNHGSGAAATRTADTEASTRGGLRRRPREVGRRVGQAIRVRVHPSAADLRLNRCGERSCLDQGSLHHQHRPHRPGRRARRNVRSRIDVQPRRDRAP